MKKISDLQKELYAIGLSISLERIREYDKLGIIKPSRNKKSNFREFKDEDYKDAMRNIILIKLGCPLQYFIDKRKDDIEAYAKLIKSVVI